MEPREYAVMRDVLATVKRLRSQGASPDEIHEELGAWGELTDWAARWPKVASEAFAVSAGVGRVGGPKSPNRHPEWRVKPWPPASRTTSSGLMARH
jgi:hypothetical protein